MLAPGNVREGLLLFEACALVHGWTLQPGKDADLTWLTADIVMAAVFAEWVNQVVNLNCRLCILLIYQVSLHSCHDSPLRFVWPQQVWLVLSLGLLVGFCAFCLCLIGILHVTDVRVDDLVCLQTNVSLSISTIMQRLCIELNVLLI